jgi:hypothetical protein
MPSPKWVSPNGPLRARVYDLGMAEHASKHSRVGKVHASLHKMKSMKGGKHPKHTHPTIGKRHSVRGR